MPERVRDWTSGFTLLGLFAGIIGSLLVAWQYHIDTEPGLIGLHFLGLNAGCVAGALLSQPLLRRFPLRWTAIASCLFGCAALLALAFVPPPSPVEYRIGGLALLGLAGGGLGASLLYVLEPYFRNSPAWADQHHRSHVRPGLRTRDLDRSGHVFCLYFSVGPIGSRRLSRLSSRFCSGRADFPPPVFPSGPGPKKRNPGEL